MMVLTSYPARRHVRFELDGTEYVATVVLEDVSTLGSIDRNEAADCSLSAALER